MRHSLSGLRRNSTPSPLRSSTGGGTWSSPSNGLDKKSVQRLSQNSAESLQTNLNLRAINLWRHVVPGARRRPLTALEELELCGGGVGDAGARELGGLSRLRVLSLANNGALSDRAVPPLARLTALRELNLSGARRITGNGILLFQALLVRGRAASAPRPCARRCGSDQLRLAFWPGGGAARARRARQPGLPGAGGAPAAASAAMRAAVAPVSQRTKRACGAM
jgi:hypothetical protein